MILTYPVTFKHYASGQVGAFFSDVPEAITAGANEVEALRNAADAIVVALSGYIDDDRPLPRPSHPKRGQKVVILPPRVALKLAIHNAMRNAGVTQAKLGELMGIDGRQVRRVLDLDHESKLNQLETALAVLGFCAEINVTKIEAADDLIAA